jgi:hypothetical protein
MFTLITILVIGNFKNGVVIRPIVPSDPKVFLSETFSYVRMSGILVTEIKQCVQR